MAVGVGFLEMLVLLFGGGLFAGSDLMGLPPGERDPALVRAVSSNSVLYVEWASRGIGKEGAPGVDGFVADAEVREFLKAVDETLGSITGGNDPEPGSVEAAAYQLAKMALMRPGCLFVRIDPEAMKNGGANGPRAVAALAGIEFALIVHGGDTADALNDKLLQFVRLLKEGEEVEGLDMQSIPRLLPGFEPVLHRYKEHFLLASSKEAAERVVEGLSGKSDGLSKHERFQSSLRSVALDRTGAIQWLDVSGTIAKLGEGLGVQGTMLKTIAATVGLDGVDSITSATGVVEGQVRTRTFVRTGGKTNGVLALTTGRGIRPADVAHIPADSDLAMAFSVSLTKVAAAARQVVGQTDPKSLEMLEAILKQLDEDLGVSIEKDLLANLGDVWTIHDTPAGGGFLVTGAILSIELRDAKKGGEAVARLLNALDQAIRAQRGDETETYLEEHEFLGQTLTCLRFPGNDAPLHPTFCLTKTHLHVALHPQPIKALLRFRAAKRPGYDTLLGKSIPVPDGELLAFSHVDARPLVRMLYAAVPFWAVLARQELSQDGTEFDSFAVPSAEAVLPYVTPSVSTTVRTPDGLLHDRRGGLPFPGGLTALSGLLIPVRQAHMLHDAGPFR